MAKGPPMMDLMEAALAVGGSALHGNPSFIGVSTDTRSIGAGELFVALAGERFDGHDFVAAAATRGAAAALVARGWAGSHDTALPLLVADDTRRALGRLAASWRSRFELALIGVTGSNGKTTVKEMCAAILREAAHAEGLDPELAVLATRGNLNNDIGLPLMLLRLRHAHRTAVLEMGMNHPGEIAWLAAAARPSVAVITNAQRAHLAGMGSLSEVAREKGEIIRLLGSGGTAVINADDPFAGYWRELAGAARVIRFGIEHPAEVRGHCEVNGSGTRLRLVTPQGDAELRLAVPGAHNARNALAAAAATLAAGAPLAAVVAGLERFAGVPGRMQVRAARAGATLIDDTYNANPDSVRAAIDVLAATPGRTLLVLGDMGEIGSASAQFHDEIGGYAKSQGIDLLFGIGEQCELAVRNFGAGGRHFKRLEELVAAALDELDAQVVVLVKGSRFMRMERVADSLAPEGDANAAH
jgi:UDP-N-acetylmuramoyl-tripeptide--D-alanyl-D-alanine ligase